MLSRALGLVHGDQTLRRDLTHRDSLRRALLRQDPAQAEDQLVQSALLRLPVRPGQHHRVQILGNLPVHPRRYAIYRKLFSSFTILIFAFNASRQIPPGHAYAQHTRSQGGQLLLRDLRQESEHGWDHDPDLPGDVPEEHAVQLQVHREAEPEDEAGVQGLRSLLRRGTVSKKKSE